MSGALPPGEVAHRVLSQEDKPFEHVFTRCPDGVTPAFPGIPSPTAPRRRAPSTSSPTRRSSAYSIFPYGGARVVLPDGDVAPARVVVDTSYVVQPAPRTSLAWVDLARVATLQIVAARTTRRSRCGRTVGNVSGARRDPARCSRETQAWTLSRGQVLQITQRDDASGSPDRHEQAGCVFGGAARAFIPSEISLAISPAADRALLAVGERVGARPLVPRVGESDRGGSRAGAVESRRRCRRHGSDLRSRAPLNAPETLELGKLRPSSPTRWLVVKSQDNAHPFHAAVYMTGSKFNGGSGVPEPPFGGPMVPSTMGDPDFVNVVPPDQFLDRYVFFADYTYPDTALTLVRRKTDRGFFARRARLRR